MVEGVEVEKSERLRDLLLLMVAQLGAMTGRRDSFWGRSVEVDVEGVFQFLSVVLLRRGLLWGLRWGLRGGSSLCGLLFVVLLAHVERSDRGRVIVEPIWCLVRRKSAKEEVEVVIVVV